MVLKKTFQNKIKTSIQGDCRYKQNLQYSKCVYKALNGVETLSRSKILFYYAFTAFPWRLQLCQDIYYCNQNNHPIYWPSDKMSTCVHVLHIFCKMHSQCCLQSYTYLNNQKCYLLTLLNPWLSWQIVLNNTDFKILGKQLCKTSLKKYQNVSVDDITTSWHHNFMTSQPLVS